MNSSYTDVYRYSLNTSETTDYCIEYDKVSIEVVQNDKETQQRNNRD